MSEVDVLNSIIIDVVASDTEVSLLNRCGNENIKICLPLALCIGKLDSLKPYHREVLSQFLKDGSSFDFTNNFKELEELSQHCKKIRVWSSHLDCDDYCLLLLICYLYPDKEISVLFSEEISWSATTLCSLSEQEVIELAKREHILTKWQKENYSNEWKAVVQSNKELRYMLNGTVVSCNFDFFNHEILRRLKEVGKVSLFSLVADLMANPIIPYVMYSDWIYIFLIERLEKMNKIKSFIIHDKKYIEIAIL